MTTAVDDMKWCAELPFSLAGAACTLRTNSIELVHLFVTLQLRTDDPTTSAACSLCVEVMSEWSELAAEPHFRGLHHVVFATFGESNVFVFDLRRCNIVARVSGTLARNVDFWRWTLLPIAAGIMGASIGVLPVHAACLSHGDGGILIAGDSGAGKSTLTVALSQRGFHYVSDDWTYCSHTDRGLLAHGMNARVKLLPDAVRHFSFLANYETRPSMNGEVAYEVEPLEGFGAEVRRCCSPRMLIFLSRRPTSGAEFLRLSPPVALDYVQANVERLPIQLAASERVQSHLMDIVASLPCWSMRAGGTPPEIAARLEEFFTTQIGSGTV